MLGPKRNILLGSAIVLLSAGIITAAVTLATHPRTIPITVPEETPIHVTLDQGISSNQNRPGDHFEATISEPVVLNDKTVIPQGTPVEGLVVDARPSGRLMGRAHLQLALESMQLNGKTYDLRTSSSYRRGGDHKKRNWAWIGGGAGGGALIGAAAAGGKGALIGGPIGAGAGTAVAYFTGKKDIHLRPETRLEFRLNQPVIVDTKS
ncbi:MAG TPA: hypothetical protein VNY24_20275 [Candidatus Acidoferrales bacterium]|jgi:hypothetical protein|nr:hypothetical protein [Candidatus Acidoferrales bacterium]